MTELDGTTKGLISVDTKPAVGTVIHPDTESPYIFMVPEGSWLKYELETLVKGAPLAKTPVIDIVSIDRTIAVRSGGLAFNDIA